MTVCDGGRGGGGCESEAAGPYAQPQAESTPRFHAYTHMAKTRTAGLMLPFTVGWLARYLGAHARLCFYVITNHARTLVGPSLSREKDGRANVVWV